MGYPATAQSSVFLRKLTGVDTVKNASNMLLHDRYLAVANELLASQAQAPALPFNPARR